MEREQARRCVIEALTQRNANLFAPIGRVPGVDLAARVGDGSYVELRIAESAAPGVFRAEMRRPKPSLFVLGLDETDAGVEAWVLPSGAFERFAFGNVLELDEPADEPLRERLAVYRNRWSLIADYAKYRTTLNDPIALRVQLSLG